jgi:hypothetical protein
VGSIPGYCRRTAVGVKLAFTGLSIKKHVSSASGAPSPDELLGVVVDGSALGHRRHDGGEVVVWRGVGKSEAGRDASGRKGGAGVEAVAEGRRVEKGLRQWWRAEGWGGVEAVAEGRRVGRGLREGERGGRRHGRARLETGALVRSHRRDYKAIIPCQRSNNEHTSTSIPTSHHSPASTMSAAPFATAVPEPMATPMSARASAGASFTPSPVIATTWPCVCVDVDVCVWVWHGRVSACAHERARRPVLRLLHACAAARSPQPLLS